MCMMYCFHVRVPRDGTAMLLSDGTAMLLSNGGGSPLFPEMALSLAAIQFAGARSGVPAGSHAEAGDDVRPDQLLGTARGAVRGVPRDERGGVRDDPALGPQPVLPGPLTRDRKAGAAAELDWPGPHWGPPGGARSPRTPSCNCSRATCTRFRIRATLNCNCNRAAPYQHRGVATLYCGCDPVLPSQSCSPVPEPQSGDPVRESQLQSLHCVALPLPEFVGHSPPGFSCRFLNNNVTVLRGSGFLSAASLPLPSLHLASSLAVRTRVVLG